MKVRELIELLKAMPQDLEVYSVTDHGQAPEKSQTPCIAYTDDVTFCLWDNYTTYEEEAEENGFEHKVVLL